MSFKHLKVQCSGIVYSAAIQVIPYFISLVGDALCITYYYVLYKMMMVEDGNNRVWLGETEGSHSIFIASALPNKRLEGPRFVVFVAAQVTSVLNSQ